MFLRLPYVQLYICVVKQYLSFFFGLILFVVTFQQAAILTAYWLSQDYITEKFCVNKDKPEITCQGSCHISKVLIKANATQTANTHFITAAFYFYFTSIIESNQIEENPINKQWMSINHKLYPAYFAEILQPPI